MTREEIMALGAEEVEERAASIVTEMETEGADLEALEAEVDAIEERRAAIIEERKQAAEAVLKGSGETIEERKEETKMTLAEIRKSTEYVDAFAKYIKTGDATEVRSLLTENVSGGTIPVPEIVDRIIHTAWERDEIMSRVRKTNLKGNVKLGVETAATGAGIHTEGVKSGTGFVAEEELTIVIVEMVPETIKKWITFSDEILDMNGEAFLDYIYDEITHRIIKKAADMVVADIIASTGVSAPVKSATVAASGIADVVNALSALSDEAANPVVIIKKASYAYYRGLAMQASYGFDPFEGLPVLFNDTLTTADGATAGNIMIVGDLDNGFRCNFPAGYEPTFKYDDLSLAEADLVKVVGRLPMGHAVVAPNHFAVVVKS
ncbi:MAG: phage major capsid protein [Oscillospiraceae bacterium]|nr:phage major capsid protein [Oscillospiraceae bacterium]